MQGFLKKIFYPPASPDYPIHPSPDSETEKRRNGRERVWYFFFCLFRKNYTFALLLNIQGIN